MVSTYILTMNRMVRIIINLVAMITGKIVIVVVGTMINVVLTTSTMTRHLCAVEATVTVEAAAAAVVEVLLQGVVEVKTVIGYQNKHVRHEDTR